MSCNNVSETNNNPLGESENAIVRNKRFIRTQGIDHYTGRHRTSKHWAYFKVDVTQHGIAICRFCHVKISFKSISNLGKHLHRKHLAELESNILPEPLPEGQVDSDDTETKGLEESRVSRFFDKNEFDEWLCKACGADCTGDHMIDLLKHALSHDKEDFDGKIKSLLEESGDETMNVKSRPKRLRSGTWKYFTVVDRVCRLARCKVCKKVFSYSTSVSNLQKHVNRKHGVNCLQATDDHDDVDDVQHSTSEVAPIWAFFKCLSPKMRIASCLICKKRIIYSDDCTELKRHLSKKHPNTDFDTAGKTFMVTDDGDFYEVQLNKSEPDEVIEKSESENEYNNEDYLDDTFYEPEENVKTSIKRESYEEYNTAKNQKVLVEPMDSPSEQRPAEQDDPVDIFGKYIVSLLKNLPKQTAARLQYDFLKQALLAQDQNNMTDEDNSVTSNSDQIPINE